MPRPNSITREDIDRWSKNIDNDPYFKSNLIINIQDPMFRETLYAGLWLTEKLLDLDCPEEHLACIQYTAGQLSYNHDPWEIHINIFNSYLKEELLFEPTVLN